jgi:hypothetical protein
MMGQRIDMDYGYALFEGNEIHVVSTIDDPPQLFLASPAGSLSKGGITFGQVRPDGKIDGMVLIQGKQDERFRGDPNNLTGEITWHVRHWQPGVSDDAQFVKVMEIRHDSVWIKGISR